MTMKFLFTLIFTHILCIAFTQQKGTLTDKRDGKTYKTIEFGNQVWMAENLNVDRFRNGDPIKEITSNEEWVQAGKNGTPGWCYYNNDPANGLIYGKLYNWHAVNDPRGLAPEGWHVPSTEECKTLINQQGGISQAGLKMKSSDTWYGGGGYNKDGFNGLAGGRRGKAGNFSSLGVYFFWWTSSKYNNEGADYCYLEKSKDSVKIELMYNERGFSVRCMKEKAEKESDINTKSLEDWAEDSQKRLQDASSKSSSKDPNNKSTGPAANLKSVVIGKQTWTSENLNVSTFRNGDPIPEAKSDEEWVAAEKNKQPAWCYPKNGIDGNKYGKLYNWYAVSDSRGLAPNGWHIPTIEEWTTIAIHLSGEEQSVNKNYLSKVAGKKMKSITEWSNWQEKLKCDKCSYWTDNQRNNPPCDKCRNTLYIEGRIISGNGTNSSNLNCFPIAARNDATGYGRYSELKEKITIFWTNSKDSSKEEIQTVYLLNTADYLFSSQISMGSGLPIRCLKD